MDAQPAPQPQDPGQQCIFCQIIAGQIPSKKVYEDEHVVALLDIRPAAPGHVLLLPKIHAAVMPQLPPEIIGRLGVVAKKISRSLLRIFKTGGTTIFVANGSGAGQKAPHTMLHIIPREEGDGLPLQLKENEVSEEYLLKLKEKISGGTPGASPDNQPTPQPRLEKQTPDETKGASEKEDSQPPSTTGDSTQGNETQEGEKKGGDTSEGEVDIEFLDQLFG